MESISWSDRDVSSDRGTTTTVEKTPRMPGPEASPVTTQRGNSTSPTLADAFSTLLLKLVEIGSAPAQSELRKRCPRKHQTPMNKQRERHLRLHASQWRRRRPLQLHG